MSTPIGPYMNEDGDWWVPVDAASFKQARREIVSCLYYTIPDEGRLAYLGKTMAWLDSDHEGGCDTDCPSNRHVLAYHFEERGDR